MSDPWTLGTDLFNGLLADGAPPLTTETRARLSYALGQLIGLAARQQLRPTSTQVRDLLKAAHRLLVAFTDGSITDSERREAAELIQDLVLLLTPVVNNR